MKVDLNCDLGESFGPYKIGRDEEVLEYVSSINVACGFHAGDYNIMAKTVENAIRKNVKIGAHPGFPDLHGFGRRNMQVSNEEVKNMILYQMGALDAFVKSKGGTLNHVKPHGALYNMAAKDYTLSKAIVEAIQSYNPALILYGLSGSKTEEAAKDLDLTFKAEVFADRGYTAEGTLVPRTQEGAFVHCPTEAATRLLKMVKDGCVTSVDKIEVPLKAETICVHGDNLEALDFVKSLKKALLDMGMKVGD